MGTRGADRSAASEVPALTYSAAEVHAEISQQARGTSVVNVKIGADVERQPTTRIEPNAVAGQIHEGDDAALADLVVNYSPGRFHFVTG
jgi:hypothetical protein